MKRRFLLSLFMAVAAIMSAQTTTITYMSDGRVYETVQQKVGEYYNVPEDEPFFQDFGMCVFAGWSTTETGTPQFIDENSKVEGETTLYARFALGSFQKSFRYERIDEAEQLTPNTEFAICAYHDRKVYAMGRYVGWTYNACSRGYSGGALEVADIEDFDFRIGGFDHNYWYKYDGEGGLTSDDYIMCHNFGSSASNHYIGHVQGARDSWGDLYGYKGFSLEHYIGSAYYLKDTRFNNYLTFLPSGYKPASMPDMGIYFAFASEPYPIYLYKKITEISTDDATFVSSSAHHNITFNIVGDNPGAYIRVGYSKTGNYAVGDEKQGFKCMKGLPGVFSYEFYDESVTNLVASWTTSDGKYTNYKGRSITLTPDQDITVTVEFVEIEKSVIINGEIYPIGGDPIELFKGQVIIDGDNVVLNDANLDGALDLTFSGANIVVNGDCTISGGITSDGDCTISGNGTLNITASKGLVGKGSGTLYIDSSVTINIIPDDGGKKAPAKRGKGDDDYYPPFAISGFEDVVISSDYFLADPIKGYYDAKAQTFMTAEGNPAQSLRIIARRALDINGDGTLSIQDLNILIAALLSEDTGKAPEKK